LSGVPLHCASVFTRALWCCGKKWLVTYQCCGSHGSLKCLTEDLGHFLSYALVCGRGSVVVIC
jgi:hypothetical protein